jgi:holo-[acyl-carrier protein] synthase
VAALQGAGGGGTITAMDVIGHGVDLVDTRRIGDLLKRHGQRFVERVFTAAERDYCRRSARRSVEHLAARFAAKEAALKAIGTGWRDGIAWTDIEVVRRPSGEPTLAVHGKVAQIAAELGVTRWLVSLSHTESQAIASVVALGRSPER